MKEGSKEWDTELVNQIFHPFDAEEIYKIRTPTSTTEGCIVWHYEKSSDFTLKSANNLDRTHGIFAASSLSSGLHSSSSLSIWT